MPVRPLHIAWGLIGCFVVVERALRQGKEARSLEEGVTDQGTTRAIGAAFGTSCLMLVMAPLLNRRRLGRFSRPAVAWSGIGAMAGGLALRIWAARVLGAYYTRTLRTSGGQRIVADGPYRLVRHPGYAGVILLWLGAGVATANWVATIVIGAAMGRAYRRRMVAEEAMLARAFAEDYPRYAGRTWRLIPWVY
jgi:protein-S-isoprenylcysteine O-methyltransferase